jgi:hypothetical protein
MFRTDLLSIIRSLNTVLTATGICHTEILKMDKIISVYTCTLSLNCKTCCLSETCRVVYQNKFEKQCILLAFILRIYHDARSSGCQIYKLHFQQLHFEKVVT